MCHPVDPIAAGFAFSPVIYGVSMLQSAAPSKRPLAFTRPGGFVRYGVRYGSKAQKRRALAFLQDDGPAECGWTAPLAVFKQEGIHDCI